MSYLHPETFLDLVQRLHVESGEVGSPPLRTVSDPATAELSTLRLSGWIAQTWERIQSLHKDWGWMRREIRFPTVEGQAIYTPEETGIPAGTFARWFPETFRSYDTDAGITAEIHMAALSYDQWRDAYNYGGTRDTRTHPTVVAVGPNKELCLGPIPAAGYTMLGDYYTAPTRLEQDTDEPNIRQEYRMTIVYGAMVHYGTYEAASETMARGQKRYTEELAKLENEYLPRPAFGVRRGPRMLS